VRRARRAHSEARKGRTASLVGRVAAAWEVQDDIVRGEVDTVTGTAPRSARRSRRYEDHEESSIWLRDLRRVRVHRVAPSARVLKTPVTIRLVRREMSRRPCVRLRGFTGLSDTIG
jgi:hypothetical protein